MGEPPALPSATPTAEPSEGALPIEPPPPYDVPPVTSPLEGALPLEPLSPHDAPPAAPSPPENAPPAVKLPEIAAPTTSPPTEVPTSGSPPANLPPVLLATADRVLRPLSELPPNSPHEEEAAAIAAAADSFPGRPLSPEQIATARAAARGAASARTATFDADTQRTAVAVVAAAFEKWQGWAAKEHRLHSAALEVRRRRLSTALPPPPAPRPARPASRVVGAPLLLPRVRR